jgi:hypothetical protein
VNELVNTEDLVAAYLKIRGRREQLLRKYEEQDKELKDELVQLESALLEVCNSVNADSIKTSHGTVMRKLNERFSCSDWDKFYDFVFQHGAPQLLEKRIHQSNFREFLKEHPDDGLPPSVNVFREYGVSVRKSNKE